MTGYEDQKRLYYTVDLHIDDANYDSVVNEKLRRVKVELVTLGHMKSDVYKTHTLMFGHEHK